jgi:hypothetical protein
MNLKTYGKKDRCYKVYEIKIVDGVVIKIEEINEKWPENIPHH